MARGGTADVRAAPAAVASAGALLGEIRARNEDSTHAACLLVEMLRHARAEAGRPTYRELAQRGNYMFSPATLSRTLQGTGVPRWSTMRAILDALQVGDDDISQRWLPVWETARLEHGAAAPHVTLADVAECGECGALLISESRHQAWHERIGRQAGSQQ
jgi:hypothetical protein